MKAKTKTNQKSGSRGGTKPRNGAANTQWAMPAPTKSNAGKIVLATLTVGAAGVVGYFGWQYFKKKKAAKADNLDDVLRTSPKQKYNPISPVNPINPIPPVDTTHHKDTTYTPPADETGTKSTKTSGGSGFPLKKGSKGDLVRQMQQALIGKYGSSILPKYGADGDFGSETLNALKKKGYPTIISESTFNVLVQGGGSGGGSKASASSLAQKLYDAAMAKNLTSVLSLLGKINNKDDYQQVSASFMDHRIHGVRQTLVNGLLNSFASDDQKEKIRMEFIRMGLQYDGSKWSLSGFDGKPIVTKEAATVWVSPTQSVPVPAMMVLGNEVTQRLDYTLFENNGKYFLVKTQSVNYL